MPEWSWSWHPHVEAWLVAAGLEAAYLWAVTRVGPRRVPPGERAASRGQVAAFSLGALGLWLASDWPVHDLAEGSMYSVHMFQHMLITLVVPPLLLGGTPAWMLRAVLGRGRLLRAARFLTRPLIALLAFNGLLVVTHWPVLVDLSIRNEPLHFALHALLFGSALAMWSPVLNPLLELPHLSYPGQIFYLFLQSIVPTVPASFLTFASAPIYHAYETLPKIWGIDVLTDQRIAGLLMKIGGGLFLWTFIAVLFFKWFAREEDEGLDELAWRDLERTLNRTELSQG